MSPSPMQFGVAPKELTFPQHTQKRKELLDEEKKAKITPHQKTPEPLPAVLTPDTPTVYIPLHCNYCNQDFHEASDCFLLHRDKLALYLHKYPGKKAHWDEMIISCEAYLKRKKLREEAAERRRHIRHIRQSRQDH